MAYIISIDQSTSGTKALLFADDGSLKGRCDVPHRQIVNDLGWVEHDGEEIIANLIEAVRRLLKETGADCKKIAGAALSNQRETAIAWDRRTGKAACNAIVWQDGRATDVCHDVEAKGGKQLVKERTGMNLSPFFSAAKMAWMLRNAEGVKELQKEGALVLSTMDSFLVYRLTKEHPVVTEWSNASRTQLLDIRGLKWDSDVCALFGIEPSMLPEIRDSDSLFGTTDFGGVLPHPVPLHAVLGDSQGALFAQGCLKAGMAKATYGTGSSVMMNTGKKLVSSRGLVTSIAWGMAGEVNYVLEGNVIYAGATTKWLKDDVKLISSSKEAGALAAKAAHIPGLYMVPAFSGLGSPWWCDDARAVIFGMTRAVGKAEIARAAEEAIAHQIADITDLMVQDAAMPLETLRVDGGPTGDAFLMQFQADMSGTDVRAASIEELSGQGPAVAAMRALGLCDVNEVLSRPPKAIYLKAMKDSERAALRDGWRHAVECCMKY